MPTSLLEHVARVTAKALMDGAFVVTFQTDDAGPLPEATLDVEVDIAPGPGPAWVLDVSLPLLLAREMAANTLGESDLGAVTDADIVDTALELANVIAGGIAQAATPEGALCKIGSPRRAAQQSGPTHHGITLVADTGARVRVGLRRAGP